MITVSRNSVITVQLQGQQFDLPVEQAYALRDKLSGLLCARGKSEIAMVKQIVAEEMNVSVEVIDRRCRPESAIIPRHAVYWLCRRLGFPFSSIAKECGERNHVTIMSGCRSFQARLNSTPNLKQIMKAVEQRVQTTVGRLVWKGEE